MFMYMKMMMKKGRRIRFSGDNVSACSGPAEYFGFTEFEDDGGVFLAETERFFKDIEISKAYTRESATLVHPPKGKYLYMEKLENIGNNKEIEVVTGVAGSHAEPDWIDVVRTFLERLHIQAAFPECGAQTDAERGFARGLVRGRNE